MSNEQTFIIEISALHIFGIVEGKAWDGGLVADTKPFHISMNDQTKKQDAVPDSQLSKNAILDGRGAMTYMDGMGISRWSEVQTESKIFLKRI